MTFRQSTIRLSVEDAFSAPMAAYAAALAQIDELTAASAAGAAASSVATDKMAASAQGAAEAEASVSEASMAAAAAIGVETENVDLMAAANTVASTSMIALAGAGIAVAGAMAIAKTAYSDTVGTALTLEQQTHKLGLEIGATAEQSSKLIYAAEVTGVSVDTMSRSLNVAIRALQSSKSLGIEPNIDGLAKLSDMYLRIQDPVQRDAFLLHEFGRSGADMAPLMALGSAGIKGLGDQATLTGNVLSGAAADQLHTYDLQMNQLTLDAKGLGVALGVELAPAATRVVDGGLNLVHTLDLINAAQKDGVITAFGQAAIFAELATGTRTLKSVYDDLAPKVQQVTDDMAHGSDASDRAATRFQGLTAAVQDTSAATAAAAQINSEQLDFLLKNADAVGKNIDAYWKLVDAQQAAIAKSEVQAGVAGTLTKNAETYDKVVDSNADKIKKLRDEIDKLSAANGQIITVNQKGVISQEDYQVAVDRSALAEAKYQDALQGTVDKHGKVHHATDLTIEGLRISAEAAKNTLDDLTGHVAGSDQVMADYSKKIGEDQAALDKLTQANADAEAAMVKANKAFIYQQVASQLTGKALLDTALQMGQIDKPTYDAAVAADALTKKFNDGKLSLADYELGLQGVADKINGVTPAFQNFPEAISPATRSMDDAAGAADQLYKNIELLHDKTITVTTNYRHSGDQSGDPNAGNGGGSGAGAGTGTSPGDTNGHGSGTGAAGGADFVVPAGYPNDSYPLRVQSGERVLVIPRGQPGSSGGGTKAGWGGGTTINNYINDRAAAALVLERQRQLSIAALEKAM